MSDGTLSKTLKKCSENDLEDMIDRGILKHTTEEQLASLLSNPHINVSLLALKKICACPYTDKECITFEYGAIFRLIKRLFPKSAESAFEDFFFNYEKDWFFSIVFGYLGENECRFLFNHPTLHFLENLLQLMYTYYDELQPMYELIEWYNYTSIGPFFFQKVQEIEHSKLQIKILEELEKEDEDEISHIISLNFLKFVKPEALSLLFNSPKSNLLEVFIKVFISFERAGIIDVFELCEGVIYRLGSGINKSQKKRLVNVLENGTIDELKMVLMFRWLEYFNQSDLLELTQNSQINFLENVGNIIYEDIVDEHYFLRGRLLRYLPRILLNVLKFIDDDFLKKIFGRDEVPTQNKKEFILILKDYSDKDDKQRLEDINQIVKLLN